MKKTSFRGAVCLVVGGSSGIGRAMGLLLCREGASVVFAGRNEEALREVVAEAVALGGDAAWHAVDVRDASSVERAVAFTRERGGRLDILFNGAGAALVARADEATLHQVEDILSINLLGTIYGVQAAYPIMKEQGSGYIVNVSSLGGLVPAPGYSAYCASKYAVVGYSETLRLEAREFGVRVSVVCPAAVRTPIFDRATYVNVDSAKFMSHLPPGGLTSPEDCASQILAGIRRGTGVITPGGAGAVARVARWFPGLWDLASKKMSANLRASRLA